MWCLNVCCHSTRVVSKAWSHTAERPVVVPLWDSFNQVTIKHRACHQQVSFYSQGKFMTRLVTKEETDKFNFRILGHV